MRDTTALSRLPLPACLLCASCLSLSRFSNTPSTPSFACSALHSHDSSFTTCCPCCLMWTRLSSATPRHSSPLAAIITANTQTACVVALLRCPFLTQGPNSLASSDKMPCGADGKCDCEAGKCTCPADCACKKVSFLGAWSCRERQRARTPPVPSRWNSPVQPKTSVPVPASLPLRVTHTA